jgi:pyridoxal biosynthesis lyase PdxS
MSTDANFLVKAGLARMLKGGVIMDVINVEQAKIAEAAGAVAVMALERIPADIRADGGVARMSDPDMILAIKAVVSIPVMAKARIGHFVEAQILESIEVDYIDESEVLTMADEENHINKTNFKVRIVWVALLQAVCCLLVLSPCLTPIAVDSVAYVLHIAYLPLITLVSTSHLTPHTSPTSSTSPIP